MSTVRIERPTTECQRTRVKAIREHAPPTAEAPIQSFCQSQIIALLHAQLLLRNRDRSHAQQEMFSAISTPRRASNT